MRRMPAASPLRLDAYIRVSDTRGRSGPSFIAPATQRDRIGAWCRLYGARVGRVFDELDESGRRRDRPLLQQALARIEAGVSDGLVVDGLDRFGRSLQDALIRLDRIQQAGGTSRSLPGTTRGSRRRRPSPSVQRRTSAASSWHRSRWSRQHERDSAHQRQRSDGPSWPARPQLFRSRVEGVAFAAVGFSRVRQRTRHARRRTE
jgi:hypothetical protein